MGQNNKKKDQRTSHKAYMVGIFLSLTLVVTLVIGGNSVYSSYANVVSIRDALDAKVAELKKCNAEVSKEIDSSKVILMSSAVDITDVAATLLDQLVHQAENMLIDIPSTPTNINQRWQVVGTLNCDSEIGSTLASLKNAQLQVLENVRNQQVAKATSESGTKMLAGAAEQARQLEQLVELEQARQLHDLELELEKARKEPQCSKTQFTNSEGVQFIGCDNPLAGDENEYEWKLWENALKDGDLCLATDVVTGKQYALTQDECH